MNFTHHLEQRVQLNCGDQNLISKPYQKNKSLLAKLQIKYQQLRLLDNDNGFNVPTLRQHSIKREVQKELYSRVIQADDLNVESKFNKLMGGYQSLNERSFVLLVDISKDRKQREDQMQVDGGNLDDDSIEREWQQLTVITSLPFKDDGKGDGISILRAAIFKQAKNYLVRHKDIANHFVHDKKLKLDEFVNKHVERIMGKIEVTFVKAEIPGGKKLLSRDET